MSPSRRQCLSPFDYLRETSGDASARSIPNSSSLPDKQTPGRSESRRYDFVNQVQSARGSGTGVSAPQNGLRLNGGAPEDGHSVRPRDTPWADGRRKWRWKWSYLSSSVMNLLFLNDDVMDPKWPVIVGKKKAREQWYVKNVKKIHSTYINGIKGKIQWKNPNDLCSTRLSYELKYFHYWGFSDMRLAYVLPKRSTHSHCLRFGIVFVLKTDKIIGHGVSRPIIKI